MTSPSQSSSGSHGSPVQRSDSPSNSSQRVKQRNWIDRIQGFTAVVALVFAGVTLYYTGSGFKDAHQQLALNEQGQLTSWYSAAISDLGSASADVRVGGIYLLRKVMSDDPSEQPVVINILTAFIQARAPRLQNPDEEQASLRGLPERQPGPDVQAALSVLADRNPRYDAGTVVDLNLTNLEGANLPLAHLSGACMVGALLSGTNLAGANLAGADLFKADVVGANLLNANLTRADLEYARLLAANTFDDASDPRETGTNFAGADLYQADLTDADFRSADFEHAILVYAILRRTYADGANFTSSNIAHAYMREAIGARLSNASTAENVNPAAAKICGIG